MLCPDTTGSVTSHTEKSLFVKLYSPMRISVQRTVRIRLHKCGAVVYDRNIQFSVRMFRTEKVEIIGIGNTIDGLAAGMQAKQ